ncbi:MAG: hypothetical protein GSR80_000122 [Desulfurococcales archaeon]|nr:hypothetical protein [Desulfurococcales archaeon]
MPLALPVDALFGFIMLASALAALIGLVVIAREAARASGSQRPRIAVLWVKSPGEMELRPARQARTGEVLVVDGRDTWVYKPPADYKPVELRVHGRLYKAYIVDKNIHAFYEVPELRDEELEQEIEIQGRKVKLNRAMLDPRTLFTYIARAWRS